jgi:hypothetical protein
MPAAAAVAVPCQGLHTAVGRTVQHSELCHGVVRAINCAASTLAAAYCVIPSALHCWGHSLHFVPLYKEHSTHAGVRQPLVTCLEKTSSITEAGDAPPLPAGPNIGAASFGVHQRSVGYPKPNAACAATATAVLTAHGITIPDAAVRKLHILLKPRPGPPHPIEVSRTLHGTRPTLPNPVATSSTARGVLEGSPEAAQHRTAG